MSFRLAAAVADGLGGSLSDGVGPLAVGALLRFDLEAHLLDDGTADESPDAVGLPAGRGRSRKLSRARQQAVVHPSAHPNRD